MTGKSSLVSSKWLWTAVFFALISLMSLEFFIWPRMPWNIGTDVIVIENNAPKALSNVTLIFRGGPYKLKTMPAHATHVALIEVQGESGLAFHFDDPTGNPRGDYLPIYLEAGRFGDVRIAVNDAYDTTWKDNTSVSPFRY